MHEITLELPAPPNRANFRGNWKAQHYQHSRYLRNLGYLLISQLRSRGIKTPLPFATWSANVETYNLMDADNLMALMKWPIDALKENYVIRDDSPKYLWPAYFNITQEIKRKKCRKLYLTLHWEEEHEK